MLRETILTEEEPGKISTSYEGNKIIRAYTQKLNKTKIVLAIFGKLWKRIT